MNKVFPHTPSKHFFSASYGCYGYEFFGLLSLIFDLQFQFV